MTLTTNVDPQTEKEEEKNRKFLQLVCSYHEQLLNELDYDEIDKLNNDKENLKNYLIRQIELFLGRNQNYQKEPAAPEEKAKLIQSIIDELLGFGPVEELLREDTITDIFVNSPNTTFVERRGRVVLSNIRFLDDDHIYRLVQRVAAKSGRHLDLGTPYLDAQLPDGSRLHAIIPPVAIGGIKVSIRKFLFKKLELNSLISSGSITDTMAKFLQFAVQSRFNIAICGGTGSGKTTLMNSLLNSIRPGERVITIEDTPELEPSHGHIIRLVTRSPNSEGKGGVSQAELMVNALRMRPDRVILGELRGAEAFNLLHAMNTGQDGSMVTLHASGAEEVVSRLLNMILMAKFGLSSESVRQQVGEALDLVVYVARLVDGSRRVMRISQMGKLPNGEMDIQDLFTYEIKKITPQNVEGSFKQHKIPLPTRFVNKLTTSGLRDNCYELLGIQP